MATGTRGRDDSNQLAGFGEFARGKEPPLSLLFSVPTDVYRLRVISTNGTTSYRGDARRLSINRDLLELSRDSNFARCTRYIMQDVIITCTLCRFFKITCIIYIYVLLHIYTIVIFIQLYHALFYCYIFEMFLRCND